MGQNRMSSRTRKCTKGLYKWPVSFILQAVFNKEYMVQPAAPKPGPNMDEVDEAFEEIERKDNRTAMFVWGGKGHALPPEALPSERPPAPETADRATLDPNLSGTEAATHSAVRGTLPTILHPAATIVSDENLPFKGIIENLNNREIQDFTYVFSRIPMSLNRKQLIGLVCFILHQYIEYYMIALAEDSVEAPSDAIQWFAGQEAAEKRGRSIRSESGQQGGLTSLTSTLGEFALEDGTNAYELGETVYRTTAKSFALVPKS